MTTPTHIAIVESCYTDPTRDGTFVTPPLQDVFFGDLCFPCEKDLDQ